jgi:hypothetical protein
MDTIPLRGIKEGSNEIILSCEYHNRMEVEDIYLIGDFGVDLDRSLTAEPKTLALGDWCTQGYFHYCGSMVYHHEVFVPLVEGTRTILELGAYSGVTIEIRVNGTLAGHVPWRSASLLDITPYLSDGKNEIDIEVMGSPRNMLGPFHQLSGDPFTTSWASFRKTGSDYTPEYKLHPYGLYEKVKIYRIYEETEVQA